MTNDDYWFDGYGRPKGYDRTPMPQPTVEDDMAAEIRRLEEENATLRATIGMVRIVLGQVSVGNPAVARVVENLSDV